MSVVEWCYVKGLKVYRLLGKAGVVESVQGGVALPVSAELTHSLSRPTTDDLSSLNTVDREVLHAPSSNADSDTVTAAVRPSDNDQEWPLKVYDEQQEDNEDKDK